MRISDWSSDVCSSDLRGELEISDVNNAYLAEGRLEVCKLPFSTEWFDVGTFDALLDAQTWVAGQQRRKGLLLGSPEPAAHREGFITAAAPRALRAAVDHHGDLAKNGYLASLLRFLAFSDRRRRVRDRPDYRDPHP